MVLLERGNEGLMFTIVLVRMIEAESWNDIQTKKKKTKIENSADGKEGKSRAGIEWEGKK